jgi:hypothetical protein
MMKALLKITLARGLVSLANYTAMAQTQPSACPRLRDLSIFCR